MDAAAFAKAALAFAEEKSIVNDGTQVAASGKVEFASLPTGYYLINTTVGTLCALDTTNETIVIDDKNVQPTIDKTVKTVLATTLRATMPASAIRLIIRSLSMQRRVLPVMC